MSAGGGGDAAGDRVSNVETLTGSSFNDILYGTAGAQSIFGGVGNDILDGGAGGDALDGGAALNDFGFTDADRTLVLRWAPVSRQQHEDIERLVQTYPLLQVALTSGVYLAAPETYQPGAEESSLRLLVTSKLST